MNLFSYNAKNKLNIPMAEKYRPNDFSQFRGLSSQIKQLISLPLPPNMIIWGPPGAGKTSLALILSKHYKNTSFIKVNAIDTGTKKIKEIGEHAKKSRIEQGLQSLLFIDEIHRLNKAQQDVLLPFTEQGIFSLIGATTENPSFELNRALLSRCQLITLETLSLKDIEEILKSICFDQNLKIPDLFNLEALNYILKNANGDARKSINLLEIIINLYSSNDKAETFPLSILDLENITPQYKSDLIQKNTDEHYDSTSALIKSIRGSDPDAGLYYLARLIKSGTSPNFIARRLVILASEDIGNADPKSLSIAIAGAQAVQLIGLPEAGINLAQVVTYLSAAPKSNRSYRGYKQALQSVSETGRLSIPSYLKSSLNFIKQKQTEEGSYLYDHDHKKSYNGQSFLPKEISKKIFYEPSNSGFEKKIKDYFSWLKKKN